MKIEEYLESINIHEGDAIYNMNNIINPRIDLKAILEQWSRIQHDKIIPITKSNKKIKTEISKPELVYAVVKINNKCRTIKVIKKQIFVIDNNIKHHLIGNLYYSILRNHRIFIIKEKVHCSIKPIILSKFTFRHEAHKKKHLPSLYKQPHYLNLKDY